MRSRRTGWLALALVLVPICFPVDVLAAEGSEDRWGLWFGLGRFFNLALVVGVVVWAARKPLASFFVNRSRLIREELEEAQKARHDAERRLAEVEARMSRLDDELEEIRAAAEREAREEQDRLLEEAERDADKIVGRTRAEISGMTRAAQLELQAHAVELSIKLAEERIRRDITDEDRGRLFQDFVAKLGGKE